MATTILDLEELAGIGLKFYEDTAADEVGVNLFRTPVTIKYLECHNNGTSNTVWFKFRMAGTITDGGVVPGTTLPTHQLRVANNAHVRVAIPTGMTVPSICYWVVAGVAVGATGAPDSSGNCTIRIVYTD